MVLEEVASCPICNNNSFAAHLECKDHMLTQEVFHVKHCRTCGLGITSPRPDASAAQEYYKSDRYISHAAVTKDLFDSIYLTVRQFTTKWKYNLVKPYLANQKLLDYGCGTGAFLEMVRKKGHIVCGVEPSAEARTKVHPNIEVVASIDLAPERKYDVITLWHVLEHVYPLRETLRKLAAMLQDNGAMFIAVPNHHSHDATVYGSHWAAYDVPRHLWHFTKESMATFLQQEGLQIKEIIPMRLDAFYVSLLSERYRSGGLGIAGIVRAFMIALKSNIKGRDGHNQSSVIFVVTKK